MKCKKIVLGYVPVMRDTFPVAPARQMRDRIRARVDEILQGNEHIELADAAPLLPDGMLWDNADVEKVAAFLEEKHADALFLPHCNFGQEEAAAKLAARLGRPVLLWGPRDPAPEGLNFRPLDIQCGLFATSKALVRYGVPFTYLENCNLDSEILAEGLDRFARTVAVVKAMRGMRVGQIGLRPRQFLSVKVNESELLEKLGIEVTPIWTEEITTVVAKLRSGNADKIGRVQKIELPMATKRLGTLEDRGPDPSIRQRMEDIRSKVDCTNVKDDTLEKIAVVELAIERIAQLHELDAIALDCWAYLSSEFGIGACFVIGDLIDRGLVVACETDIHAAITAYGGGVRREAL